ncbi:MAG TPA: hypothetical protein VJ464_16020 [Blastocatellia bacterium]|nr:hypothetical protein [Blastocatellia bacterium]
MHAANNNLLSIEVPFRFQRFVSLIRPSSSFIRWLTCILNQGGKDEQVERLINLADYTYTQRRFDLLEQVGILLHQISNKRAGEYYLALVAKNKGYVDESLLLLDRVVESSDQRFRARGFMTLGSICFQENKLADSFTYELMALETAREGNCDPFVAVEAQRSIALFRSLDGDRRQAITVLENLFPLVRIFSRQQPLLYYQFHNSYAVELGGVGRHHEALSAIGIALASRYASAYPEWQETRAELVERGKRASRSVVEVAGELTRAVNVVRLDEWSHDQAISDIPGSGTDTGKKVLKWKIEMAKQPKSEAEKESSGPNFKRLSRPEKVNYLAREILKDELSEEALNELMDNMEKLRSTKTQETK